MTRVRDRSRPGYPSRNNYHGSRVVGPTQTLPPTSEVLLPGRVLPRLPLTYPLGSTRKEIGVGKSDEVSSEAGKGVSCPTRQSVPHLSSCTSKKDGEPRMGRYTRNSSVVPTGGFPRLRSLGARGWDNLHPQTVRKTFRVSTHTSPLFRRSSDRPQEVQTREDLLLGPRSTLNARTPPSSRPCGPSRQPMESGGLDPRCRV